MEDKILKEITTFCETCGSKEDCPEGECVLYRIEKIVNNQNEPNLICESCWKPIEGYSFELDGTTMCSECYEYHGGFENERKNDI